MSLSGISEIWTDIFGIGHGCVQVEVLEINCAEARTFSGKNTV